MECTPQEACTQLRSGFELLVRDVDVFRGGCQILRKINCFVRSGELLAMMGPSGAGKSTLLNAISGRLHCTSGDVILDGQPISKRLRRKIGYVLQQDIFFPNLTLRQTLKYTAALTLPDSASESHRAKRIDDVVRMLGLDSCLDTVMGGGGVTGLSGGERKRASIACEMLMQPALLLVDEPTSGLDVVTALTIMKELKKCTVTTGQTVIATIHQPSSQVFHIFDRVLLLSEGEVAYFGEATKLLRFFAGVGYQCGPSYNPADFALEKLKLEEDAHDKLVTATRSHRDTEEWREVLQLHQKLGHVSNGYGKRLARKLSTYMPGLCSTGTSQTVSNARPTSQTVPTNTSPPVSNGTSSPVSNGTSPPVSNGRPTSSPESQSVTTSTEVAVEIPQTETEIIDDKPSRQRALSTRDRRDEPKWHTGSWTQLKTLTRRSVVEARARVFSPVKCVFTLVMALFCGAIWCQLPRKEETVNDRMGMIFFAVSFLAFLGALDPLASVPPERHIILKERSAGMYRLSSYSFSKVISDLPLLVVHTVAFVVIYYWMVGLDVSFVSFICHLMVMVLIVLGHYTMGMFIAVSTESFDVTITTLNVVVLSSIVAGGFYLKHFPSGLSWIRYLSLIYFGYNAILEIEFRHGSHFDCAPPNTTIYPECLSNTTHVVSGAAILDEALDCLPLWLEIVALSGYALLFKISEYVVLRYIKNPVHLD